MNEKGKIEGQRGIVLVPARHFVFQSFEPVEGIQQSEAIESAVLSFEESVPYPLDQTASGHFADPSGRVVIWGCETAVLPTAGSDEFLLPEFFPLLGWEREPGTIEYLESDEGGCLLFFDAGGLLPTDVVGLHANTDDSAANSGIESTFSFLARSFPGWEALTRVSLVEASSDSRGRFQSRVSYADGQIRSWDLSGESLWAADLRPATEIQRFRNEKKSAERIWVGAKVAAVLIVLLCLAQGLLWGFQHWVTRKEATEQSQAPMVRAVEERADLASRLNDLGESRVSVFERLGELNLARPDGIQFLDVNFDEPDIFRIEGRVTNVRVLNEYVDLLKSDGRFSVTAAPPPRSRDGRVEFELSVQVPNQGRQRG